MSNAKHKKSLNIEAMSKNINYILVAIIAIILIGGGVIFYSSSKTETNTMPGMPGMAMQKGETNNQPVFQSHRTYSLKLTSPTNNFQPNVQTTITYKIVDEQGNVLKDFTVDHTKLMHFILVRKDLQDFQHIHPDLNKDTGEFTIPTTFSENGPYRLFADFVPAGAQMGEMGMPLGVTAYQDVNVGDLAKFAPQDVTVDTQTTKTYGQYQIEYKIPQTISTGNDTTITLHVTKNGTPVTDMEEYLGSQAHGILLHKDTLDFAHLHATEPGSSGMTMTNGQMKMSSSKGPDINFTYNFPASGIYKLFTQFQEQGQVITVDYTLQVK